MPSGTITAFANGYAADGALTAWTNPENVYSDNGTCATRVGTDKSTWYGNLFTFDLSSLDANCTIVSATLTAEWNNSAADTNGPEFYLNAYHAGTLIGAGTTDTTGQVAPELVTYTPTVTPTILRATGGTETGFYGVMRFRRTDNTAHVGSVDYLKIDVIYNLIYNITGATGQQTQSGDIATFKTWNTITPAAGTQTQTGASATFTSLNTVNPATGAQAQTSDAAVVKNLYTITPATGAQAQVSDAAQVTYNSAVSYSIVTPVLDNFNRANENPLNVTNWGSPFTVDQGKWKVLNNQAVPVT